MSLLNNRLTIPDPQEVTIVRPDKSWTELIGSLIGTVLSVFIRAAVVSWAATHVEMIPDWGFWESFFVVLLGSWIFHSTPTYTIWSKGWSSRMGAARDFFSKGKK